MTARALMLRRHWPLAALLASAAILATAHAFQAFGYQPCDLCLKQREVYWGAIGVALIGTIAPRFWPNPLLPRTTAGFLGIAFLAGAAVAFYHAGVEWKIFAEPAGCTAAGGEGSGPLLDRLDDRMVVVPCGEVAWRDPALGLSMAVWNGLLSLGLAALSFWSAALPIERPSATTRL